MNGQGIIQGTFNNFKQNLSKVKDKVKAKITPTKEESKGDDSP